MNGTRDRLKCNCFQVNEFVFIFKWFAFFHYDALTTAVLQRGEGDEMLSFLWCPRGVDVGGDVGNWLVRAAEYTDASYGSTWPISTEMICHIENMSTATSIYWTGNSTLNVFSPTRTLSTSSGACKSMVLYGLWTSGGKKGGLQSV
jgi:hypothetical protein